MNPGDKDVRGLYGQRHSACYEASRQAEFARIKALSARERMLLSLALGRDAGNWTARYQKQAPPKDDCIG
jgi:hypothetical protein